MVSATSRRLIRNMRNATFLLILFAAFSLATTLAPNVSAQDKELDADTHRACVKDTKHR
ncbi:hypothetical protein ACFLQW_04900 [Candidatus Zixiibacteriota bacterium]